MLVSFSLLLSALTAVSAQVNRSQCSATANTGLCKAYMSNMANLPQCNTPGNSCTSFCNGNFASCSNNYQVNQCLGSVVAGCVAADADESGTGLGNGSAGKANGSTGSWTVTVTTNPPPGTTGNGSTGNGSTGSGSSGGNSNGSVTITGVTVTNKPPTGSGSTGSGSTGSSGDGGNNDNGGFAFNPVTTVTNTPPMGSGSTGGGNGGNGGNGGGSTTTTSGNGFKLESVSVVVNNKEKVDATEESALQDDSSAPVKTMFVAGFVAYVSALNAYF